MKKIILLVLSFQLTTLANSPKAHRHHGAHQHGAGQLSIAFDKNTGRAELKASAVSIIGFEHTAKTAKDQKIKADQLATLEGKISEILQFQADLNCKITKEKIEILKDEKKSKGSKAEHSDILAEFNIECLKSPIGSKLIFNFQKFFKNLEDLDVQILVDDFQKSLEVKKSGTSLTLAP